MPDSKRALSVFLSITLTISVAGFDGCNKPEETKTQTQSGPQAQAPATTYAVPTADQLYQLVAPMALFPDNLVAQVLAAATYPDQVSSANTWLQQNSSLKGDQLMQAADQQQWDASVKGLTQFPDVLNQMATNLSWTSALGDAYFNVPQNVMNAVQVMRQRAYQAGNLKTNQQQNVTVQNEAPASAPASVPASSNAPQTTIVQAPPQTIIIQPAQPQVVYVPAYNPTVVYGAPVPAYPGYSSGDLALASVLSFGVGIAVGAAIANNNHCCGWGWNSWGCGWHNSTVVYNRNTYISTSNTFVNRNNYYNRNVNNVNVNNINRNNINHNNLNNNNYRANNFNSNARNSNFTTPKFNQKNNQPQFNNDRGNLGQGSRPGGSHQPNFNNRGNTAQNNRQQIGGGNQPNFNQQNHGQQNRAGQNQSRPNNLTTQRESAKGYGQQANRGNSNAAFGNYSPGGNARTNSARGQQSLSQNRAPAGGGGNRGGASRPQSRPAGGRRK